MKAILLAVALLTAACNKTTPYDRASPEEKQRMTHEAWRQGLAGNTKPASNPMQGWEAKPRPIPRTTH